MHNHTEGKEVKVRIKDVEGCGKSDNVSRMTEYIGQMIYALSS